MRTIDPPVTAGPGEAPPVASTTAATDTATSAAAPIAASARRRRPGSGRTSPSASRASSTRSPQRRLPSGRVLRHRAGQDVVDAHGELRTPLADPRRLLLEVRVHDRDIGRARERERAGERLEQEAAERVHVSTSVHLVAADLLGSDVVDGSHELPVGRPGVTGALCQPEVGEICVLAAALLVEQDVGRLHVAVDEPLCVRRVERVRDLGGDRDDRAPAPARPPAASNALGRSRPRSASR